MNIAYLLTGSNLGSRRENLEKAKELIAQHCGEIVKVSSVYETEPWGNTGQPAFLNQALEISTPFNAMQLIRRVLKTEKAMGRVRKEKYGPRIIDIDILLFNEDQFNYPFLNIPHPEMHRRRFALVPLAEIAPETRHQVFGKTISQLLFECEDPLEVHRM